MMSERLAIRADAVCAEQARQLADQLSLPLVNDTSEFDLLLEVLPQGLQLQPLGKKVPGPTRVDFVSGSVAHRRQFGGGKGQMIAKAVGIKGGVRPEVLDATAGLGKDAFVLATLGCEVTLLERAPVVHALLADGLWRANQADDMALREITARMQLVSADSLSWMQAEAKCGKRFAVVYLDPMFPHNDKTALVKKEMRTFRPVVGDDLDADGLLAAALQIASHRVVVKRPRKAPFLAQQTPSFQLEGKSSRYDIYTLKKL
ncbi:class I SAM-dependent methyltransferase [Pontibacter sp. JAM-7]|uniref:class I SAM-dependent methyltransferase n=1 Tax=Pontibacter sp. JAM-7 TaxID=3366581 RepID=UPI003AF7BD25